MDIEKVLEAMTPDIYQKFKTAIELGKWADGNALSQSQKETCMQAIIAYEHKHMSTEERTGYVPPKPTDCGDDESVDKIAHHDDVQPLNFKTEKDD